jgi:o-succinylbenzoate synthase
MHITLHPYHLPLTEPIELKGLRLAERRGLLVRMEDAAGRVGWGDCAPLPGFSSDSIETAQARLGLMISNAPEGWPGEVDPQWAHPEAEIHRFLEGLDLPPAGRFALELALLDLAAQAAGRPLPNLLHPDPEVSVELNGLVVATTDEDGLAEAERLAEAGYRTLKLKVGRRPVEEEIALVGAVRRRVGPDVALRLDANQAWKMPEALAFAEGIQGLGVEYVEEPLDEPTDLPVLWYDSGMPIALDESLKNLRPEDLEGKGWASAVVLKPTILGGVMRTLALAERARQLGIQSVISAAFESGIAMRAHVALAAATGGAAAGLDPYRLLAADVLAPRLPLDRPVVDVPGFFRTEREVVVP